MRAHLMRATSLTVLAMLIASTGLGRAQQTVRGEAVRAGATRLSLPEGADEGASDQRMVLPDLPPTPADIALGDDVTGSLGAPVTEMPSGRPSVPPVLSYEDAPAPAAGPVPAVSPPVVADAPALPEPPTTVASPASPQTGAIAAEPGTTMAAGLDAAAFASALAGFVADLPVGDTPVQAAERRAQREAIAAFYASRGNAPLWFADGIHLTPAARAVEARLGRAADDGLDVARFAVVPPREGDSASVAKADLSLSEAVLAYARQASGSRVNVARIGGLIDLRPTVADAARVLGAVPGAVDAGDALQAFNPPQPGYVALRDKLTELRQSSGGAQTRIPYGPVLKPGMSDPRVAMLRLRFGLDKTPEASGTGPLVYDTDLADAVAAFQRSHHMPASGLLTARTVAALSVGNPAALENNIIANMELWRWMPRDLAQDRIEVNIPDYTARVFRDGETAHETRVVVGQPDKPTPVFAEQMRFIIVNPYWNVPLSIIKNEMMPKLAADPSYFADHGYEVVEHNGTTYVRQPPGDGNALGRIKFMFPNSHSVYLHDTNARSYFARDMRALSHGCVRVEEPFSFAEAVMGRQNGWSEARIRKLIGGQERTINLPRPLPILITYFTAFVDKQAGLQVRDDVYGYAAKVQGALGLGGDIRTSDARPAKRAAAETTSVTR